MQGLAGSTRGKFQGPVRNTDHPLEGYFNNCVTHGLLKDITAETKLPSRQ